jgi:pantoate--beta-alanine ligase
MKVFERAEDLLHIHSDLGSQQLAFIPTMGALHQGHLSLVRAAQAKGHKTVVSIFVNPLQFNNSEDLLKYPRTLQEDLKLLDDQGVDWVFTPNNDEMYPASIADVEVDLGLLEDRFEGAFRPGHFHGVVQVVYRLFKYVNPSEVFFGQKDLQQCLVIEQLIEQVFPHIKMHRVQTMREDSGLAMSSRNVRLSPESLLKAAEISKSLKDIATRKEEFCEAIDLHSQRLEVIGIEVEYLNCVSLPWMDALECDHFTKEPNPSNGHQNAVIFAGSLNGVRLIDNWVF